MDELEFICLQCRACVILPSPDAVAYPDGKVIPAEVFSLQEIITALTDNLQRLGCPSCGSHDIESIDQKA
jgi:hypothetical protein